MCYVWPDWFISIAFADGHQLWRFYRGTAQQVLRRLMVSVIGDKFLWILEALSWALSCWFLGFFLPQIRIMRPCERGSQCTIHRNDGWRQSSLMKVTILKTKRCYKHFLPICWFSQLVGGFSSVFRDFHQRSEIFPVSSVSEEEFMCHCHTRNADL